MKPFSGHSVAIYSVDLLVMTIIIVIIFTNHIHDFRAKFEINHYHLDTELVRLIFRKPDI